MDPQNRLFSKFSWKHIYAKTYIWSLPTVVAVSYFPIVFPLKSEASFKGKLDPDKVAPNCVPTIFQGSSHLNTSQVVYQELRDRLKHQDRPLAVYGTSRLPALYKGITKLDRYRVWSVQLRGGKVNFFFSRRFGRVSELRTS